MPLLRANERQRQALVITINHCIKYIYNEPLSKELEACCCIISIDFQSLHWLASARTINKNQNELHSCRMHTIKP